MNWIQLKDELELKQIMEISTAQPVLIFKHSTRCSISSTALNRLERSWKDAEMSNVKPYFLDLLSYRNISNKIEEVFHVHHESPQALIISNGKCVYYASHLGINYDEILKKTSELAV